jgi:hypothetical protein
MPRTLPLGLATLLLAAAGSAAAALPFGTLEFVDRVADVAADQVIDVRMRFTLDPGSSPLDFSSNPLTGFDPADLPTGGTYYDAETGDNELRPIASYAGAFLNTYFVCNDSFTGGCNGDTTNYRYGYFTSSQPGKPVINFLDSFSLAPGASTEYVFAQFTPAPGHAQPGVYRFYGTGLTLNFRAVDADGNDLFVPDITLGAPAPGRQATTAPSRATWWRSRNRAPMP